MQIEPTAIEDVKVITPRRFADHRGFFSETYNRRTLADAGIELQFVQDNHSLSAERGTMRGLHFQTPPFEQAKLVRVMRGTVLDVAVDLRRASDTFGQYVAVELSAGNWRQLLVPVGFAHGFMTLEPNTEVAYKVTNYYSAEHDRGLLWNDSALDIDWPVSEAEAVLSEKDQKWPTLAEFESPF